MRSPLLVARSSAWGWSFGSTWGWERLQAEAAHLRAQEERGRVSGGPLGEDEHVNSG